MYFTPGGDLPVFTVAGTTIGIQICNDRLYPEASRVLALKGAEIIFMPICYATYSDPVQQIDLEQASLSRKAIPWWRDRRPDLYGALAG